MKLIDTPRLESGAALPPSLYAAVSPEGPRRPLNETRDSEVAIVGAGILGLSTALALAERGVSVTVLEANSPGWGASGRNGGQVNSGLKHGPDEVARDLGAEAVRFAYGAPGQLRALVARLSLDCDYVNGGGYRAARDVRGATEAEALVATCARHGIPADYLGPEAIAAATGTGRYTGALFDPEAGQVNPLKYTQALARAATAAGAKIHGDSPVTEAAFGPRGWTLTTPLAQLRADKLLLATNGYSAAPWSRLRRSLLPIFSTVIASAPLPGPIRARLLARREVLYETSQVTVYYRVDTYGRLVLGGRGPQRPATGAQMAQRLRRMAERTWPELRGITWTHGWNGRLALTDDHYPHLHPLAGPGLACVGFNGRGVALTTALGPALAEALVDDRLEAVPFPSRPMRPIPFQAFWPTGVAAALGWHGLRQRVPLWPTRP